MKNIFRNAFYKAGPEQPCHWYVDLNKGAIRLVNYKMDFLPKGKTLLYNLVNDIAETRDLFAEEAAIAKKLQNMYAQWKASLPTSLDTSANAKCKK